MISVSQKGQVSNCEVYGEGSIVEAVGLIVNEIRKLLLTDAHAREAMVVACGKFSLNAKESALMTITQGLQEVVTQVCANQEKGYLGASTACPKCGAVARFVRHDKKQIVTLVGTFTIYRSLYQCQNDGCKYSWRPLDEHLDLPQGHYSERARRLISLVGGCMPFERASEVLFETTGISISATKVRMITEEVGADIGRLIEDEISAHEAGTLESLPPADVLVVGADGAHLNTREGSWKETKVGSIRRYQRAADGTLKLKGSSFTAHLGNVEEFRPKLDVEIERNGYFGKEATIFLGDGAHWIWNMADEISPDSIHVLDYYHLCEHVWETGRILLGEESAESKRWSRHITEDLLRQEKIDEAINAIRGTCHKTPISDTDVQAAKDSLVNYIENNRKRMRYKWLESHGYPIGSGHVESACKQIVCKRHKQAGMRWSQAGAQQMLNLAAFIHGNRWDEYWQPKIA